MVVRSSRSPLWFSPDALGASTGTLTICDEQGVAPPRAIVLSLSGRARLESRAGRGVPVIRTPRGFTLIETLVSLVVLSVGLLGAAALLLDNLRSHAGALRRVAALSLVRDMADRIRANPRGGVYYNTGIAAVARSVRVR